MLTESQGTLDVMVQRTGDQGEGNVLFVQNNFYYDAFFLKAIGTSTLYPSLDLSILISFFSSQRGLR